MIQCKFTPHSYAEKKMQVLWLRYLTEIDENSREVPEELLANPEIKKAVTALEESAFTPEQLLGYEKFWDMISTEKTLINGGIRKGKAEGLAEGLAKGKAEGLMEGKQETARNLKALGVAPEVIAKATGMTLEDLNSL